jgi:hypothetical protein
MPEASPSTPGSGLPTGGRTATTSRLRPGSSRATESRPSIWITVIGIAYTVLAIAALSRSAYQAATGVATGRAVAAVTLSALAGVVYLVAAIALRRGSTGSVRLGRRCLFIELLGVIAVSLAELAVGGFGRAAVWSGFGVGYGYLPVLLPIAGLWLTRPGRRSREPHRSGRNLS